MLADQVGHRAERADPRRTTGGGSINTARFTQHPTLNELVEKWRRVDRQQPCHRSTPIDDDNLLAGLNPLDPARQLSAQTGDRYVQRPNVQLPDSNVFVSHPVTIGHRALDRRRCTAECIRMTTTTGASETWQARITHDLAAQLRNDAELLGLDGRTEIVKAALEMLHRRAAEERMARSVDDFYGTSEPPLPIGVRSVPATDRPDATS